MRPLPDSTVGDRLIDLLPRLRRFATALCRSRDVADDLVQTACEKALAASASWTPGTRFDAWLFRILRNAWIDALRRRRSEGPAAGPEDLSGLIGARGDVEVEARLMLQSAWEAIGRLPDDQREVLLLVCVEEFSYGETAGLLGIPMGTVMSRLARARERIAAATGIERGRKR